MMKIQIKCDDIKKWSNEITDARWMTGNGDLSRTHDKGWWQMNIVNTTRLIEIDW